MYHSTQPGAYPPATFAGLTPEQKEKREKNATWTERLAFLRVALEGALAERGVILPPHYSVIPNGWYEDPMHHYERPWARSDDETHESTFATHPPWKRCEHPPVQSYASGPTTRLALFPPQAGTQVQVRTPIPLVPYYYSWPPGILATWNFFAPQAPTQEVRVGLYGMCDWLGWALFCEYARARGVRIRDEHMRKLETEVESIGILGWAELEYPPDEQGK